MGSRLALKYLPNTLRFFWNWKYNNWYQGVLTVKFTSSGRSDTVSVLKLWLCTAPALVFVSVALVLAVNLGVLSWRKSKARCVADTSSGVDLLGSWTGSRTIVRTFGVLQAAAVALVHSWALRHTSVPLSHAATGARVSSSSRFTLNMRSLVEDEEQNKESARPLDDLLQMKQKIGWE